MQNWNFSLGSYSTTFRTKENFLVDFSPPLEGTQTLFSVAIRSRTRTTILMSTVLDTVLLGALMDITLSCHPVGFVTTVPILQIQRTRPKEVMPLVQGNTEPGFMGSKSCLFLSP